ncbi:hypothetical protein glysoja_045243 [Glycine soja]|uniref:Uncharacterized protein n=1 Tax=Glycine soja TaxID=3848 RepID=A0A0B2PP87_GLYSO|nr:hypothetical protein glysoja_045243 [Glycine soja]
MQKGQFRMEITHNGQPTIHCKVGSKEGEVLRYVGGVGISFSKDDQSKAYGTLVVFDFHTLQIELARILIVGSWIACTRL